MVVTLSPFKTNLDISDVLLPVAPFSETSGSFVNAEGRLQSFHAVVRPLGDTRPATRRPCVAGIYQLDPLVRRAPALQRTADARRAAAQEGAPA